MELLPNKSAITEEADRLGVRYGEVIVRNRRADSIIDFVSDHRLNPAHIWDGLRGGYRRRLFHLINGQQYVSKPDTRLLEALSTDKKDQTLKSRATKIGAAVAGFVGLEQVTDSLAYSSTGVVIGALALGGAQYGKYISRVDRVKGEVKAIENALGDPEKRISLSTYTKPKVLSENSMSEMTPTMIEARGIGHHVVSIEDVFKWTEKHIAHGTAIVRRQDKQWREKWREMISQPPGTEEYNPIPHIETEGIVLQANIPLSSLFLTHKQHAPLHRHDKHIQVYEADEYLRIVPEFATQLGIPLTASERPDKYLDNHSAAMRHRRRNAKDNYDWKDATVTVISLPPALVILELLKREKDPTELWSLVAGDLTHIQHAHNLVSDAADTIQSLLSIREHTGVVSREDEEEIRDLTHDKSVISREIFDRTLNILATAMVRSRVQKYDAMREKLFDSISVTAESAEWQNAMKLFDEGISALISHVPPDSDQSIEIGQRLLDYLVKSAELMRDPRSYAQFYEGMRIKFPELKLQRL